MERVDTVIIGGGQAGLAMGYYVVRQGRSLVVLEAHNRVGDSWRNRWDSLRLFTPARHDALPGTPFPDDSWAFPACEEFADYLEAYAREHALPVRTSTRVRRLGRGDGAFVVETDGEPIEAKHVVIATGFDQLPRVPGFAADLDASITQVHSVDYRNPAQISDGAVLVVGAGNSGADIALELAQAGRHVILAGRHPGQLPWRIENPVWRPLGALWFLVLTYVLTERTPIGRRARPQILVHSGPLIRVKRSDLAAAEVRRVPRVVRAERGLPVSEDGTVHDVAAIVWCTGYRPDYSWIDLPVLDVDGHLIHERGVTNEPGLYVLGQLFQFGLSSSLISGVGRDAEYIADHLARTAADRGARREVTPA